MKDIHPEALKIMFVSVYLLEGLVSFFITGGETADDQSWN